MRWAWRIAAAVLAGLLFGLVALLLALWGLPNGPDRLARWLQPHSPIAFDYVRFEGPLRGPWRIEQLTVRSDRWDLAAEQIELAWHPAALLRGTLHVERLAVQQMRFRNEPPAEPEPPREATLPAPLRLPLAVHLDQFQLDDGCYQAGDAEPECIDGQITNLRLDGSTWAVDALALAHPRLQLSGRGNGETAGRWPFSARLRAETEIPDWPLWTGEFALDGDLIEFGVAHAAAPPYAYQLAVRVSEPLGALRWQAEWMTEALRPQAFRADVPEAVVLSGTIQANGTAQAADVEAALHADGAPEGPWDARLTGMVDAGSGRIDRLTLDAPIGRVRGQGQYVFSGADTDVLQADLSWEALRWPGTALDSPEGKLSISGQPTRYDLSLQARLAGAWAGGGQASIALAGEGNRQAFEFSRIEARNLLKGRLDGRGQVAWAPELTWDLALRGQGFDPGALDARWPGRLAFDASTRGQRDDAGLAAELQVDTVQGRLRGRTVQGRLALQGAGSEWTLEQLDVRSGEARMRATGRWGPQIAMQARLRVPDLADLWPGASGRAELDARADGPQDDPQVELEASAREVRMESLRVSVLDLSGSWGGKNEPLQADASIRQLEVGSNTVDSITLDLRGRPADHRLSFTVDRRDLALQLASAGGWTQERWVGRLTALSLRPPAGAPWQLDRPAPLQLSMRDAALEGLCLRASSQSLCADGRWSGAGWQAQLRLADLDLAPWRVLVGNEWTLAGTIGATVDARGDAERLAGTLSARADGVVVERRSPIASLPPERLLTIPELRLSGEATDDGLTAGLSGVPGKKGRLEAQLAMPGYTGRWRELSRLPVEGRMVLETDELAALTLLSPHLDQPQGRFSADLAWRGPWQAPVFSGGARLAGGSVDVPVAGLQLRDIALEASPTAGDQLQFAGQLTSGGGDLSLQGQLKLQAGQPQLLAQLKGRDVLVANTAEAEVRVSPDIQVGYAPAGLSVQGQLTVPQALLKPKELEGTVRPSSDEIIVGAAAEPESETLAWNLDLRLILGDRVRFEGFGLKTDITGQLGLREGPGTLPVASGELVLDGRYRAYGQDLTIERGRILYTGVPLDSPGLDLRASRRFQDQTVGVEVRGLLQQPDVKVFSAPLLPQSDALAYLVLGRPLNQASSDDSAAMNRAAAALGLAGGELLAQRIGGRLGVQDVEIRNSGDVATSELSFGRYLTPRLYISYGVGVFNAVSTLRTRYELSRRWTLRTESGVQSSIDAIYTLER